MSRKKEWGRRILRLAICFGWLDHEQRNDSIPLSDPETAQIALDIARSGIVLLKNQDNILPFEREYINKLAVVGPYIHPGAICGGGSVYIHLLII